MKTKVAGVSSAVALCLGFGAAAAWATPNPTPDSIPASCHGYDVSSFAQEFGGVAQVANQPGGYTVQTAQKADQYFCKTGILLPPPSP